jgi:hypothetical protein
MPDINQNNQTPPFAVSRVTAAKLYGECSLDTIDRLVASGVLEKVQISPRRVAITWRSLAKLLPAQAQ